MTDRLSTTLIDTAARFRADADAEVAGGSPEAAETLTRIAAAMERLAVNHRARAILTDDRSHDPVQIADATDTSPERFIARRKSLGLTQAEVAAHFGVSKSTVSHWEQGVQRIPGYAMLALDALSRLHE